MKDTISMRYNDAINKDCQCRDVFDILDDSLIGVNPDLSSDLDQIKSLTISDASRELYEKYESSGGMLQMIEAFRKVVREADELEKQARYHLAFQHGFQLGASYAKVASILDITDGLSKVPTPIDKSTKLTDDDVLSRDSAMAIVNEVLKRGGMLDEQDGKQVHRLKNLSLVSVVVDRENGLVTVTAGENTLRFEGCAAIELYEL